MSKRKGFAAIARGCAMGIVEARREQGELTVTLNVGDLLEGLRTLLPAVGIRASAVDVLDICQVLESEKFQQGAGVQLIDKHGPKKGVDTVYRFWID